MFMAGSSTTSCRRSRSTRPSSGPGRSPSSIRSVPSIARSESRCGLPALGLEPLPEARELLELLDRRQAAAAGLAAVVGVLVVDELQRELVSVLREKPSRAQRVALPDLEHMVAHDPNDAVAQRVRIAQPKQRLPGELATDLLVAPVREAGLRVVVQPPVRPPPRGVRLAQIVEQRGEAHRQRVARVRRGLDDREGVLVDRAASGSGSPGRSRSRASNSGSSATSTPVSRARRSAFAGLRAEQQLRQLPHPVGARARRRCARPRRASPLRPRRASAAGSTRPGSRSSCETNRSARTRRSGSSAKLVGETVRSTRCSRSRSPCKRVDELARREPPRHRVDGEVAAAHVVLDRE